MNFIEAKRVVFILNTWSTKEWPESQPEFTFVNHLSRDIPNCGKVQVRPRLFDVSNL